MSEAPAQTGESDSSGSIEPERFRIDSAFPPPPEKQGKTVEKSGNQGRGSGSGKERNENGGPASPAIIAALAEKGVGSAAKSEDERRPEIVSEEETNQNDISKADAASISTKEDDEVRATERIPRSHHDTYESRRQGPTAAQQDRSVARAVKEASRATDEAPTTESAPPDQAEILTPERPPHETKPATPETSPEQAASNLFLELRSGKTSFRDTTDNTAWQAQGKMILQGKEPPYQVFKEVDGGKERKIPISKLREIANARAGYQRPEPIEQPTPTPAEQVPPTKATKAEPAPEAQPTVASTPKQETPISPVAHRTAEALGISDQRFQSQTLSWRILMIDEQSSRERSRQITIEQIANNTAVGTEVVSTDKTSLGKGNMQSPPANNGSTVDVLSNPPTEVAARQHITDAALGKEGKPPPPNEPPKTTRSASPGEIEPEGEKHKNAELTAAQIITIDKLLGAQTDRSRETRFDIRGTKAALKEVRKQLGIKTRIMNEEGKLKSKFLDELRKAREEGRITLKEPNTQKPEAPPPPRGKVSEGLSNVVTRASRLAEKAGKVATGVSSLTLTRQAEEGLRGAAEKSENKYQKFLYNAAAGFLNRFRWADKEQGTYAIGVGFGAATSILLGPAGNIVKIPILIGLNGIAVPGINFVRVRFINNALKPHIEDGAKREELSSQFDNAYRLWRPDSKEAFDNEIKRLSTEVAQGHDVPVEAQMLAQEEIQRKMESLNKYTRAQSHIRSFAAGLSAGSITASAGEAIFHGISSLIGGGGGSTAEGGTTSGGEASTNTPTPSSGEQPTVTPTPVVENEITDVETTPATEIGPPPGGINQTTWENFNEEQRDAIQFIMDNPDRQDDFVKFIAATQESAASNEVLGQAQEIIQNPDFVHSVEIAQGSTVSEMLASNGYDITWTTNDADIFGGHVLANYEELQQMHEQVKEAGIPLEFQDYPTPQEVVSLIKAAEGGDAAAFQQLVAASHWIPEGGSYNILTESGFEALKQKYGLS